MAIQYTHSHKSTQYGYFEAKQFSNINKCGRNIFAQKMYSEKNSLNLWKTEYMDWLAHRLTWNIIVLQHYRYFSFSQIRPGPSHFRTISYLVFSSATSLSHPATLVHKNHHTKWLLIIEMVKTYKKNLFEFEFNPHFWMKLTPNVFHWYPIRIGDSFRKVSNVFWVEKSRYLI